MEQGSCVGCGKESWNIFGTYIDDLFCCKKCEEEKVEDFEGVSLSDKFHAFLCSFGGIPNGGYKRSWFELSIKERRKIQNNRE